MKSVPKAVRAEWHEKRWMPPRAPAFSARTVGRDERDGAMRNWCAAPPIRRWKGEPLRHRAGSEEAGENSGIGCAAVARPSTAHCERQEEPVLRFRVVEFRACPCTLLESRRGRRVGKGSTQRVRHAFPQDGFIGGFQAMGGRREASRTACLFGAGKARMG